MLTYVGKTFQAKKCEFKVHRWCEHGVSDKEKGRYGWNGVSKNQ